LITKPPEPETTFDNSMTSVSAVPNTTKDLPGYSCGKY
jgi:hypothetical protein